MKLSLVILVLFLFPKFVRAQSDWPPDPAQIFAPNVTVVSVDYVTTPPDTTTLNQWEFTTDAQTGRIAVANASTGEPLALLPPNMEGDRIEVSPDAKHLLLYVSGLPQIENGLRDDGGTWLYSLALDMHQLINLGSYVLRSENWIDRWLDSNRAVMYNADMPEGWAKELLYFDLTQPDSLREIITGRADYHDDPPRYEFVETQLEFEHRADSPTHTDCSVEVFDLSLMQNNAADLGEDCFGAVQAVGRNYYFVIAAVSGRALYRLNLDSGERSLLYSASNLAGLDSISPDGHYAVLLHDNGKNSDLWTLDPFHYSGQFWGKLFVFDLTTGQVIREIDNSVVPTQWFSQESFIIPSYPDDAPYLRIEHISDGQVTEQQVDTQANVVRWLANHNALLYENRAYSMLKLDTGTVIPITLSQPRPGFGIEINDAEADLIHVTVGEYQSYRLARYTVRLH